jgi:hypothetical protein
MQTPLCLSLERCTLSDTCTAIADPSLWHGASRGGRSGSNLAFMRSTHYPTATPLPFGFRITALSCVIRISDKHTIHKPDAAKGVLLLPDRSPLPVWSGYPVKPYDGPLYPLSGKPAFPSLHVACYRCLPFLPLPYAISSTREDHRHTVISRATPYPLIPVFLAYLMVRCYNPRAVCQSGGYVNPKIKQARRLSARS